MPRQDKVANDLADPHSIESFSRPIRLRARFRLTIAGHHFLMRLWGRVGHAPDHIVAAARDFFVAEFFA
jgi:hypothetical protein